MDSSGHRKRSAQEVVAGVKVTKYKVEGKARSSDLDYRACKQHYN